MNAESVTPTEDDFPCLRCGDSPHWHRLDDSLNIPPTDPSAQFRCLGVKFDGCHKGCPDFVAPPGYEEWIAARIDGTVRLPVDYQPEWERRFTEGEVGDQFDGGGS